MSTGNAGTPKEKITVLHANTMYPTPMKDVNLVAMQTIRDKFDISIGYSDHTIGIEVDIAAVALGARVIEKHFTLDKKMDGPDHVASLDPNELKSMITAIRNIELAMGKEIKDIKEILFQYEGFGDIKNYDTEVQKKSINQIINIKVKI